MRNLMVYWLVILSLPALFLLADDPYQEFKVKRKNIFEFTKKPELKEEKNSTTISFTVKDFCDVTIAIENLEGKILRHLVSGVLGSNAPEPFKKDSLEQSIVWDNKDDAGKYLDNKVNLKIRVSLGLQAEYEKDLYYSPYKRISSMPLLFASPEGVYVYEGWGRDHLRLFGHDGVYSKTIYPFPASQLKKVKGLNWVKAPDGHEIVEKEGSYKQTLLTSGVNDSISPYPLILYGAGATGIAVKDKRIALAYENINRIDTDGGLEGLPLKGPKTGHIIKNGNGASQIIGPTSMAFSPDGKTVYFTGYMWQSIWGARAGSVQAVFKMNYDSNDEIKVFAGFNSTTEYGSDDTHFTVPTSVDTDQVGNVYVSDFVNDRIQIFDSNGKLLKSLSVKYPAKVLVNQKTNEINIFSWAIIGIPFEITKDMDFDPKKVPQKAFVFSPYPELKLKQENEIPLGPANRIFTSTEGQVYQLALDAWAEEPTVWVVGRKHIFNDEKEKNHHLESSKSLSSAASWSNSIRMIKFNNNKWEVVDDFNSKTKKDIVRTVPPVWNIQQLYFNPQSEKLYVGEADSAPTTKAFSELIEIDPVTNKTKLIQLPFNPQDIDFDNKGLIYMRTMNVLARYDMATWQEVPFDYGSELAAVGGDGGIGGRQVPIVSGIMLPATNVVCYLQSGLSVNVRGDIAVPCGNRSTNIANPNLVGVKMPAATAAPYAPIQYPGRYESPKTFCLHIWDKHGKQKFDDVVKGSPQSDGVFIDKDCNVFMMSSASRIIQGKPIGSGLGSTLIKFKSNGKGRFLTTLENIPIPLNKSEFPKRSFEIRNLWVDNAEWMYGGCGFSATNGYEGQLNDNCCCWLTRFKLDYFARSFVPETLQYSIAVVDSAGNLILKIGQYGNEDSKGKNSKEPLGGDEVGLFHPCFVATHTDRRLFISDIGNENIMSVKLKYAVDESLLFKK